MEDFKIKERISILKKQLKRANQIESKNKARKLRLENRIAQKRNYRLKIENELKRDLKKEEIIHHIDCDQNNNDLKNLLITTMSEHKKLHYNLELCAREMLHQKIVLFDPVKKVYYLNQNVKFYFDKQTK